MCPAFCHDSVHAFVLLILRLLEVTRYRPLWDVAIAGLPRCPVWCRLSGTSLSENATRNTKNGRTVLPIANLMADSELGRLISYSSFLVTVRLSRLVSEIFACDRQTERQTDGQRRPLLELAPMLWREFSNNWCM